MAELKPKKQEHYIIFKGEEIVGTASTLKEAKEKYDSLPPMKAILDGRAIYKEVKGEKRKK